MFKKIKNGFTLVELLVVIAILSILATVSVVSYTSFIEKSAISTDSQLVTQLNNFKTAYEIANNQNFTKDDICKMLEEAELSEITLQSEKYGYGIYYNTDSENFELIKEAEVNENIHVMLNFTSNGDDTDNPNIDSPEQNENNGAGENEGNENNNQGAEGGDGSENGGSSSEGGSGTGDNTGSDNDGSDVIEPEPTIEFIINPNSLPQSTGTVYANYSSETNELNVGISIYNKGDAKYATNYLPINLSSFITASNNADINFECVLIQGIDYDNYNVEPCTISNDASSQLTLRKIGRYLLTYSVGDIAETMIINVYNTKYEDAILSKITQNSTAYHIKSEGKIGDTYAIRISPLHLLMFDDYVYNFDKDGLLKKISVSANGMPANYIEALIVSRRIQVEYNGEIKELIHDGNAYCFKVEGLKSGTNNISIVLRYQGYNGVWIEKTLSVKIKESPLQIVSITILE